MKAKGIVERYEGIMSDKIIINLKPTARVITDVETGEKKYSTAWKNTTLPKIGDIVRINFRVR